MPFCLKCGRTIEELGKTGQGICPNCGIAAVSATTPQSIPTQVEHRTDNERPIVIPTPQPQSAPSQPAKPSNTNRNTAIVVILIIVGSIFASAFSGPRFEIGSQTVELTKTGMPTATEPSGNETTSIIQPRSLRPPSKPSGNNLTEWAHYAMDRFDCEYNTSNVHATRDNLFKMIAIHAFVDEYLTYEKSKVGEVQNPLDTLKLRTGVCVEYATLMASFCESVGLDALIDLAYASRNSDYVSGDLQKNHALCMVYFNANANELDNAVVNLRSFYRLPIQRFWHVDEPARIIVKEDGGFAYINSKYSSGIWVSFENWDKLKIYQTIDYSNDYLNNFQEFRAVVLRPFACIQYRTSPSTTPAQEGYLVTCQVQVTNLGGLKAKNVVVWLGADAGNTKVYAQGQSSQFDLASNENRVVTLSLKIPSGVKTRLLVRIWGSNFEQLQGSGEWSDTGTRVGFVWKSASQGDILTITVTVTNYGEVPAKNVVVWAAFDAGSGLVYNQQQSAQFDLVDRGTRLVILQVRIPRNVHTRVLVRVSGSNFSTIETQSDWFDT